MMKSKWFLFLVVASWETMSAQITGRWGDQGDGNVP